MKDETFFSETLCRMWHDVAKKFAKQQFNFDLAFR